MVPRANGKEISVCENPQSFRNGCRNLWCPNRGLLPRPLPGRSGRGAALRRHSQEHRVPSPPVPQHFPSCPQLSAAAAKTQVRAFEGRGLPFSAQATLMLEAKTNIS